MATIEIPKVRKESTIIMYVSLTDNGVTVDWTSLSEIKPFMYSDEQHCIAGKCTAEIVTGSPETLIVRYPTTAPQFLGQNSLLIRCTYDGNEKSFDVPVLEFVDRSSEATGVTVIEDPELPVTIEVQDVDTSVLDDAIAAALDAAAKATAAAELVPLDILAQCQAAAEAAEAAAENCAPIIGQNGNWWIYDYDTGAYVDSGKPSRGETGATGATGATGPQGIQGNTGSSVEYPFELVNNRTTDDATKALSAAEGKRLGDDLSQLDQKVEGLFGETDADFTVTDEEGRPIVIFSGGHIRTKYFDSGSQLKGKKVSIIGDSISTALNKNAVEFTVLASDISEGRTLEGYPTYYDIGTTIGSKTVDAAMVGVLTSFTPVSGDEGKTIGKVLNYNAENTSGVASYEDTWWYKLASALGMEVLQNVSWSGASISSHEKDVDIYKTSYAWHPAQINKLATRDNDGNPITPDVVIIYRGTNDMSHSPYASLTQFGADATSIPSDDYEESSYDFKVGYCLTIQKIRQAYPLAKIILCTLNVFKRVNYSQFPTNNGYNTLPEYNNAIREVADMMGCAVIEFDKDGITFENCYPTYMSDSSTTPSHPNPLGHDMMAKKAIVDIKKA